MRDLPVTLGVRPFAEENRRWDRRLLNGSETTGGVIGSPNTEMNTFQNPATALPSPVVRQPGLSPSPPPEMVERANRAPEFNRTPPPVTTGAPGPNLPNLDQLRTGKSGEGFPAKTTAKPRSDDGDILPLLPCADCEGGGGGGDYYPPGDPRFSTARTWPGNQTGEQGVDLGSRNFNWAVTLLSLPGRAGLDLNLTLSYNSLVWTRDGSYIKYIADLGTPAPGFRLGLPTLQQRFYNSQTGMYAYMMVTSSGARVELRQIGQTNVYESADSSYTQLIDNGTSMLVRTSDGTQLTFVPTNDITTLGYRCVEVKDRNGNYLSATYDLNTGRTLTITDTLGRATSFNYPSGNLDTITQLWNGVPHEWARFEYQQQVVAPSFGGGLLVNGPNNQSVTVLTKVILQNLDSYSFDYNASTQYGTAFGQVNRINHNAQAPDNHLLAYTSYNVNSSSGQTECPRFTERHDWAQDWINGAEAITYYAVAGDGSWTKVTSPDWTIYKEYRARPAIPISPMI